MVLADLVQSGSDRSATDSGTEQARAIQTHAIDHRPPLYKPIDVAPLEKAAPDFVVSFTEDKNGFYINHRKFAPDESPMTSVHVGSYQHWRIVNETAELHPFHIHQVHFLAYAENGVALAHPAWLDTVNVPYHGSVDVIMDFTDPITKGMSVFHCHLLNHEDKGMMAKILLK
jgi:FtsP/CotA-like multicopper oxidase with cupredoxin domain